MNIIDQSSHADYIIPINKPIGISSNKAIAKLKFYLQNFGYKIDKIGHCGTLDPMASGLLMVCINNATKFSKYALQSDKSYLATIQLGVTTDTFDRDGKIIAKNTVENIDYTQIRHLIYNKYIGKIYQTPPIYSALKLNGLPFYKIARNAKQSVNSADIEAKIQQKSRNIFIYKIDIMQIDLVHTNTITLKIACSSGTYIRSIANDIGIDLACGAHLMRLERISSGAFSLSHAFDLQYINHDCIYNNNHIHENHNKNIYISSKHTTQDKSMMSNYFDIKNIRNYLYLSNAIIQSYAPSMIKIILCTINTQKILQGKTIEITDNMIIYADKKLIHSSAICQYYTNNQTEIALYHINQSTQNADDNLNAIYNKHDQNNRYNKCNYSNQLQYNNSITTKNYDIIYNYYFCQGHARLIGIGILIQNSQNSKYVLQIKRGIKQSNTKIEQDTGED